MSGNRRLRRLGRASRPQAEPESEASEASDAVETAEADPADLTADSTADAATEDAADAATEDVSEAVIEVPEESGSDAPAEPERRPSRVGRRWLVAVSVVLVLLAGGAGAGGYFTVRANEQSRILARNDAAALQAAKDCVAVTQAPDPGTMTASEQKIIDCGTDAYRSQALLYSTMLVQAYQAANVHVQVSDLRAAVERNNSDGTIDVLVALRVRVANDQEQPTESGYRLRVKMAFAEGQYRIAKLDQVTK